ncbi:type II secretion system protein [Candidatus Gracilibacteria bacterium]|nr:type II secretion system protein [Candidatus Gracilibacteria bacterium]
MKFNYQLLTTNHARGFTLIETLIGIAVIALVITATAELTQGSIKLSDVTHNQFAAYHLAEEGLEIVRNKRDSNWLQNRSWDTGLDEGTYVVTTVDPLGRQEGTPPWTLDVGTPDESERFRRTITISYETPEAPALPEPVTPAAEGALPAPENATPPAELMHVISEVKYTNRGKETTVTLETILSDWRKGPL